jgi:hypothetical protein
LVSPAPAHHMQPPAPQQRAGFQAPPHGGEVRCYVCQQPGHMARSCPRAIRPPGTTQ